jgi:hypothetical protein
VSSCGFAHEIWTASDIHYQAEQVTSSVTPVRKVFSTNHGRSNLEPEWLQLLIHIREGPGSDFASIPDILSDFFVVFLRSFRQMLREYLELYYGRFLPHNFQFIVH